MVDLDHAIRVVRAGGVHVQQLDEDRWFVRFPAAQPQVSGVMGPAYLLRLAERLSARRGEAMPEAEDSSVMLSA